jgi:hypothetical protein
MFLVLILIIKSLDDDEKFLNKIYKNDKDNKDDKKISILKALFTSVINRIFYIFSFILYKIEKCEIKSNKKINNINKPNSILINKKFSNLKYLKIVFLLFICFLFTTIIYTIKIYNKYILFFTAISFGFITLFFLNIFLLHKKIYKHHKLSLFLIILFNLSLYIYYLITANLYKEIFNIFYFVAFSINYFIYQIIIEKYFISIYMIFFIESLMYFMAAVVVIIDVVINGGREEVLKINIIYCFLNNLFYFTYQLFILLNIYYFSPIKCITADLLARNILIIFYKIFVFKYRNNFEKYSDFILIPLNLFLFLIYDEILNINLCGLNENIKKNIKIRQEIDVSSFVIDDIEE